MCHTNDLHPTQIDHHANTDVRPLFGTACVSGGKGAFAVLLHAQIFLKMYDAFKAMYYSKGSVLNTPKLNVDSFCPLKPNIEA